MNIASRLANGDLHRLREAAQPLTGAPDDHNALLAMVGDARFVLLGEASHGTHEFYRERARITQRLIAELGFSAVAIEGDWPDSYRVNRFVRGTSDDTTASQALAGFERFPTWMWRNHDVVDLIDWLHQFNRRRPASARVGFYGLDLYSLRSSMAAVLAYFERIDPQTARLARERYACFDHFGDDSQNYGLMVGLGAAPSCEDEVVDMLVETSRRAAGARGSASAADEEAAFDAEQNALLVKNAEAYYRSMYWRDVSSWNLRDSHMAQALQAVERHLGRRGGDPARIVVWAHNSHLGDARATEMGQQRGEHNLGQLTRERVGRETLLVGFTTHTGSVTAATDWGAPAQRKQVLPSRADSCERLLHATGLGNFMLPLRGAGRVAAVLREPLLERAIGVIYRPETERHSHYFTARLADQFDAVIHIDRSRAVQPLERGAHWHDAEVPETYPSGL